MMLSPDSITLERLNMKVYIEPIGGLCNRMRVIASAYQLIRPQDGKLIVKWTANEELNCPAKALFSLPRGIRVVDVTGEDSLAAKLAYYRLRLGYRHRVGNDQVMKLKQAGNLIPQDKTYYETCETFHRDSRDVDCSIFTPAPELEAQAREKIEKITQGGTHRVIGLHIRRTDHSVSIRQSPTELFCRVLEARLKEDSDTRFYLATDDAAVRQFFADKYNQDGEIVFFNDSETLGRDTAEGIRAAFVELLTLSMTQRIYGSCGSSYTDMAAAMGHIPLDYVTLDAMEGIL